MIQTDANPNLVYCSDSLGQDSGLLISEVDEGLPSTAVISVITRANLSAPPWQVWDVLMFYEQIEKKPSLFLRFLLPIPTSTDGRASVSGELVKCHYVDGHLIKQLTNVTQPQIYAFTVVEQHLRVGRGIKLLGGGYKLRELPQARTELTLETRYTSPHRPRWLWKGMEAVTCHLFHRRIVDAMRRKLS